MALFKDYQRAFSHLRHWPGVERNMHLVALGPGCPRAWAVSSTELCSGRSAFQVMHCGLRCS